MITLTRRYRFSASHRLHSDTLSPAENIGLYGKCNNPFGHGHDYVLEVTAAGEPDNLTGLLCVRAHLDALVNNHVIKLLAHRNLNVDVARFERVVPTTENLALFVLDLLRQHWDAVMAESPARLLRVHLQETDRNGFEVALDLPARQVVAEDRAENVIIHA